MARMQLTKLKKLSLILCFWICSCRKLTDCRFWNQQNLFVPIRNLSFSRLLMIFPLLLRQYVLALARAYEHRGLLIGLSASAGYSKSKVPNAFAEIITQCPQMCSLLSYAQV